MFATIPNIPSLFKENSNTPGNQLLFCLSNLLQTLSYSTCKKE
jgi:hypothetical protein